MVNLIAVPASLISISTHKAATGVCNDSSTSHISKTTETAGCDLPGQLDENTRILLGVVTSFIGIRLFHFGVFVYCSLLVSLHIGRDGLAFQDTDMQQNFWVGGCEVFIGLFGGWLRLVGVATW